MSESSSTERRPGFENEFLADGTRFIGDFIMLKGKFKYPGIFGMLSLASLVGINLTGEDIVHFADPVTEKIDQAASDLLGVEVAPATDLLLPFTLFVKHINAIHWPQAAAEFVGFMAIGYGFGKFADWRAQRAKQLLNTSL